MKDIAAIIVLILLGSLIWMTNKSCAELSNKISKHGLKNTIEEIWEGPDATK